jgi:acyl dehydratase
MTYICRLDQVAGAPPVEKSAVKAPDDRAPDILVEVPTSTQSAQIFALTGDQNPLHMVPEVAAKAGFPAPILHGVATYGLCAAFAEKALCMDGGDTSSRRLSGISGKFSAPVFPGETIELALWRDRSGARIEARAPARKKIVFSDGRVEIEEGR